MEVFGRHHQWIIENLTKRLPHRVEAIVDFACEECYRASQPVLTTGYLVLGIIKSREYTCIDEEATQVQMLRHARLCLFEFPATEGVARGMNQTAQIAFPGGIVKTPRVEVRGSTATRIDDLQGPNHRTEACCSKNAVYKSSDAPDRKRRQGKPPCDPAQANPDRRDHRG
jgi:hypothetical protein